MKIKSAILREYRDEIELKSKRKSIPIIEKEIGIKAEGEPRDFFGFTLLNNHIWGRTIIHNKRYLFVTAMKPTRRGFIKFYVKPWDSHLMFEWESMEICTSEMFVQYLFKVKEIYSTGKVECIPIAEQLERSRKDIAASITSGRKWSQNSVYGFKADIKAKTLGCETEFFTKEEREYHGFCVQPRSFKQKKYNV